MDFPFMRLPPELQLYVLDFIVITQNRKSLVSAALVSNAWFERMIGILWQHPPAKALAAIHPQARRQFYAAEIRELDIGNAQHQAAFEDLNFASLEQLHVINGGQVEFRVRLRPYLQSKLQVLKLDWSFDWGPNSFDLIEMCCSDSLRELCVGNIHGKPWRTDIASFARILPKLRCLRSICFDDRSEHSRIGDVLEGLKNHSLHKLEHLSLISGPRGFASEPFCEFLRKCVSLRKFSLDSQWIPSRTAKEILEILAACDTLEELRMSHDFTKDSFTRKSLQGFSTSSPFKNIRCYSLKGDSTTIEPLLSFAMNSLTKLDLVVEDNNHSVCNVVGGLTGLSELSLVFKVDLFQILMPSSERSDNFDDWTIAPAELGALSSLVKLRKLSLRSKTIKFSIPWLTDDYFAHWISNFPMMEDLSLHWQRCPLTVASIASLAKTNPLLRESELMWSHDLTAWHELQTPLFPRMRRLRLGSINNLNENQTRKAAAQEAERYAEMFSKLMPKLHRLVLGARTRFQHVLLEELSRLLR